MDQTSGQVVTMNLVIIVVSALCLGCSVMGWIVWRFQTKEDAKQQEHRLQSNLDKEAMRLAQEMKDVHKHLHQMRDEVKGEQLRMQHELGIVRETLAKVSEGVMYIRGKMEAGLFGIQQK